MIKPCAIYYRDHQAHAWKFDRTSTPETANLVVNTRISDSDPREYLVVPVPVLQQLYKGALPVHLDSTQTQGDFPGMVNAMRPSIDHGLLSPSGHVSKRARRGALKRAAVALFGPGGLQKPQCNPTIEERRSHLLNRAQFLEDLAAKGLRPIVHRREAAKLRKEAEELA